MSVTFPKYSGFPRVVVPLFNADGAIVKFVEHRYFMRVPAVHRRKAAAARLMSFQRFGRFPFGFNALPVSNTGGMDVNDNNEFESVTIGYGKGVKVVSVPKFTSGVDSRAGFIDWVSYSFHVSDFYIAFPESIGISDDGADCVISIAEQLKKIFGFAVTSQRLPGINFYKHKYQLGDGWGFLLIGGQKETVTIMINGQGCAASKRGWEKRLYLHLQSIHGKITRLDLSADYFKGQYSIDKAKEDYLNGAFHLHGKEPSARQAGNWLKPDGKGRTLYIGNIENGKELCIYEKGLQLGGGFSDLFHEWVRVELRLGKRDRVIPFDALLCPGQYLAGSYPALNWISKIQSKVATVKAKFKIEFERGCSIAKKQFGKWIYAAAALTGSVKGLVTEEIPERLNVPDWRQRILDDMNINDLQGVYIIDV